MAKAAKVYDVRDKGECRTGFVVLRTRRVAILHEIRDFHDYGFVAFFGLSSSKIKALKGTHVVNAGIKIKRIKSLRPTMRIQGKPMNEILAGLRASKAIALVEFKRKGKIEVFLGKINRLDDKSFCGDFLGTDGKFFDSEQIALRSIVRIQWDDPYCRIMTKIATRAKVVRSR